MINNENPVIKNKNYKKFSKVFLEENAIHNLISKNDEKYLYEKHYFDSLGISIFLNKYGITSGQILDIGCGGGFPSVPIALEYPKIKVTAVDSIKKKIASVNTISEKLNIQNLNTICTRIEAMPPKKYDIVVSRAVARLDKISLYALPFVKKDGWFIAYKSKKSEEEILSTEEIFKQFNAKIADIIEYRLPLEEIYDRKLICIKKL